MKPSPSNDLNLMSNVALTDRMEQVDVGSLWVGIGDDEPDFMSMDTLEQTMLTLSAGFVTGTYTTRGPDRNRSTTRWPCRNSWPRGQGKLSRLGLER